MRRLILYLFIGIGLLSCTQKKSNFFTIEGSIEDANDSIEIYLHYLTENDGKWERVEKKTFLSENRFYFEDSINELVSGTLVFDNIEIPLYLEPSDIKLEIDKNNPHDYQISGLIVEREYIKLRNILSDNMIMYNRIADSIQEIFYKIDFYKNEPDSVDNLMQKAHQLKSAHMVNLKKLDSMRIDFVVRHNKYQITPHLLYIISKNNIISNDTVEILYNKLPEYSKKTLLGRLALEQINETKLSLNCKEIVIGVTAPDFLRKSIKGETIKLSDFRNENYVLLDFWASWCAPCIKEIPQIKKIYEDYSDIGLKIIGVSSDDNKQDWLHAVEKYSMDKWTHVLRYSDPSDNFFIKADDISEMYGVDYIPLYILIDKKGEVINKWQHIDNEALSFLNKLLSAQ